jgi:hypothetical protein
MKQPLTPLLILLPLIWSSLVHAQTPAVEWQHCYGGPGGDYAFDIQQTTDGGFITAGYTEADGGDVSGYHGNASIDDFWVVKTDKDGKIEWQKCFGGDYVEFSLGAGIRQTQDGNYILAGTSASVNCNITTNHGGVDFWLVKIDSKGNVIWNKCYGGSQNDYAYSMCIAADGGYIVSGNTLSSDGDVTGYHKDLDGWIIKVSKDGILEWQKDLGGTNMEEFYGVDATPDGGCVCNRL